MNLLKNARERYLSLRKHGADRLKNLPKNATERYPILRKLDYDGRQIIFIAACIVGVCADPFFLYIPYLSHTKMCLGMNTNLWKFATVWRTVADFFTILMSFNMSSAETTFMFFAIGAAIFPLPQWSFSSDSIALRGKSDWPLFIQYGGRLVLVFQACEQLKTRLPITTLERFNALVYLFLYFIVSHVIGASWYYLSITQQVSCWRRACKSNGTNTCVDRIFRCDGTNTSTLNSTLVNEFCYVNLPNNTAAFNYGIYLDAFQSGIVEKDKGLLTKILRCFLWGLRNLSSFASNLVTSPNDDETLFAIIISVVGVILLIYIIGNIQRYAELASARSERIVDKMKLIKPKLKLLVKSHNLREFTERLIVERIQKALENDNDSFNFARLLRDDDTITESLLKDLQILETSILNPKLDIQRKAEKWLSDNNIPPDQSNILFYLKCRLEDDQDVNLKSVLSVLPYKTEWMTKKDLCFDTLKKVPRLQHIDEEWFITMSSKLKPVIYPKESYIFQEGEPLDFIIFITNGIAWSYTTSTNAGGRVSVSSKSLQKGDFFGEELVEWKLDANIKRRELESDRIPLSCIPISTANVKSHTKVEALVLMTEDLALCSDFLVATSKLRRIIKKQMILNAFLRKRSADSAVEGVDRSSRTEEGEFVPLYQREIELV